MLRVIVQPALSKKKLNGLRHAPVGIWPRREYYFDDGNGRNLAVTLGTFSPVVVSCLGQLDTAGLFAFGGMPTPWINSFK